MTTLTKEELEEDTKEASMTDIGFDPETIDGKEENKNASN